MGHKDEPEDKWAEDFCSPAITRQKIDEIKARASSISESEVDNLVGEIKFLRWLVGGLVMRLEHVEEKLGTDISDDNPESSLLRYARFIISSWD